MKTIDFNLPYNGRVRVSSPYGWRYLNGVKVWHDGVDLVGLDDKRILAPCDGVIGVSTMIPKEKDKTRTWEWGNYVRIDTSGLSIYLCHMEQRFVVAGQRVKKGDVLGIEGNTGYSFGNHCHFEIRMNGQSVDPCSYLGIENSVDTVKQNAVEQTTVKEKDGNNVNITQEQFNELMDNYLAELKKRDPDEWSEDARKWAEENGIIKGDEHGNKQYRMFVTREQLMVFLSRLHGKS